MDGPRYLNFLYQLMAIRLSSGFFHLQHFTFYEYTTNITYKRLSVAIVSVSPNEILTQLPGMLTLPLVLADLASGSTSPNSSLQQPPHSDHRLSLTVANSYLLTALGPCLSLSNSSLIGNLVLKPLVWVSHQNRQRNPLTGTHPHNECPPLCHKPSSYCIVINTFCIKNVLCCFCSVMP